MWQHSVFKGTGCPSCLTSCCCAHNCKSATRSVQQQLRVHSKTLDAQAHHTLTGSGTAMVRSKRPGRVSAGSRDSGMLVAAMTMTPSFTCGTHACSKVLWVF